MLGLSAYLKKRKMPVMILWAMTSMSYAEHSTELLPVVTIQPQKYQAYIDTHHCTAPIRSSPYVIVGGNGGGKHHLSCPADHPVMSKWEQQWGFGGLLYVTAGGGRSWITCCAVGHRWQA